MLNEYVSKVRDLRNYREKIKNVGTKSFYMYIKCKKMNAATINYAAFIL